MCFSAFAMPVLLVFPVSFHPESADVLYSTHSFSSTEDPFSDTESSSFILPLNLIPTDKGMLGSIPTDLTDISKRTPTVSVSSLRGWGVCNRKLMTQEAQ